MDELLQRLQGSKRWLVIAILVAVVIAGAGSALWLTRDKSYSQQDITAAKHTISTIQAQFKKIDSLTAAKTASENLANNKATLAAYDEINAQIKTLGKSPVQHNAGFHKDYAALSDVWQKKYTFARDDLAYLRIVDTYDNDPSLKSTNATSNAAALKVYEARAAATRTAENSLNGFLSTEPDLTQAKADFATYLSDSLGVFTTITDSLKEGKDLASGAPVADKSKLAQTLTQETQDSLTNIINTYLQATNANYQQTGTDLNKLDVQTPLANLTKSLDTAKPTR